jgi:hypothetical protein
MNELIGYIETTKIQPSLENITITPSKQEQNFESKVDGYDKIKVNAIQCETLSVKPKGEKQVFEGMYDKVNVSEVQAETLTITPSTTEQSFNGLYGNVFVERVIGDTLNITPTEEQQTFTGLYENVIVEAVENNTTENNARVENSTLILDGNVNVEGEVLRI